MKNILLIMLAVLALGILSWDYTAAHSIEGMLNQVYCPVCEAFTSVEFGVVLFVSMLFIGCVPLLLSIHRDTFLFIPAFCNSAVDPDRAPPAAA